MTSTTHNDEFWDAPGLLRASDQLSTDECWALIAGQTTGRIGFLHEGQVTIWPLNCIVYDRGVYFRTAEDGVIARSGLERAAFQLDHIDSVARSGWTILVNGRVERVTDPGLLTTLWGRPTDEPWAPGQRNVFFCISGDRISGRRVHPTQ